MGFGKMPPQNGRGLPPATQSQREEFAVQDFKNQQSRMLTFGIPLVIAASFDTLGTSVGLLDDDDIINTINAISKDAGRLFKENESGLKITGEIATALIPIFKVPKLIQAGKLLDTVLRKLPAGKELTKFLITSGKNRADRIRGLQQELKVLKIDKGMDITQNANLIKAIRREKLGAAADSIKENIAIDATLYLGLSDSELFFPSDQTGMNLALYTIPTAVFGAGAYFFTGKAIMRSIAATGPEDFATELAASINSKGIKSIDVLNRKGTRGIVIADAAATYGLSRADKAAATTSDGISNSLGREKVAYQTIQNAVEKLGGDSVYGKGIDGNFRMPPESGENLTAAAAFADEPSLAVGVTSLVPLTAKSQIGIPAQRSLDLTRLNKEITALDKKLSSKSTDSALADQLQFDILVKAKNDLENAHMHTLETNGAMVPLPERKWSVLDDPSSVKTIKTKEGVELTASGQKMGFTNTGAFIQVGIKNTDAEIINGVNATSIIPTQSLNKESLEFAEAGLEDITLKFSNTTPIGSKFISDTPLMKKDFSKLTANEVDELQKSFISAGLQKQLRELADADGLIPLYQTGRNITKTGNAIMNIKPVFSEGKSTLKSFIQVDDVIGIKKGQVLVKDFNVQNKLKAFQAQTFDQRTTAFVLAQRFVDNFDATGNQIIANEGRTWLELDVAAAVLRKNIDEPTDAVKWGANPELKGQALIDEIEYVSLVKKQNEYAKLKMSQKAIELNIIKANKNNLENNYTIATRLNLPNPTGSGAHPLVELFDAMTPQVGGTIPSLKAFAKDLPAVKQQMAELVKTGQLDEVVQTIDDVILSGNSLRFDKDAAKKPVIMMSQNRAKNRIGPDELNSLIEAEKLNLYSKLDNAGNQSAPLVDLMFKAMRLNPDLFTLAGRSDLLIEGTQAGRGIFSTRKFANRNSEVIQAMDLIQDIANKGAFKYITNEVFKPYVQTFNKFAANENTGSLISLNQTVNELRNGWDVLPERINLDGGKVGLALESTTRNIEMYKAFFGRDLTKDIAANLDGFVPMPIRSSTKVGEGIIPTAAAMDELAFNGLSSITDLSHQFLNELNFLRNTRGLSPINKRNFHVPFYDLSGKNILHITDMQGRTVNIVSAGTEAEAKLLADKSVKAFADNGGIQTSIQTEDFTARHINNSGGQFEAPKTNFGFSGKQTGRARGLTSSPVLDVSINTLQDSIKQLESNFSSIMKYTSSTVFESEVNYAKAVGNSLPGSATAKASQTTIFDEYKKVTEQTAGLTDKTGTGKLYYGVEQAADLFLGKLWSKYQDFIPSTSRASMSEFEKFNSSVGDKYNPFNSFTDFLEKTNKAKIPPTSKALLSKLNVFTTNIVLRIADPGMPLINFASIAAVSPAVMAALRRGKNESFDGWKKRIGIIGSPISETDIMPSTTRMIMSAIHNLFQPEFRAAIKKARVLGLGKQEVAERLDLITSPIEGYVKRISKKGIDYLSVPTDLSEQLSREISFAMFYDIGKRTMRLSDDAAVTFAHKSANEVVGDYRASNRPQIFQGATGMPFGLFTTWAWNFGQRVFGDLEGGRMGAVAVQAFTHSMLFGVDSLPGYETATNVLTASYDGKTNIVDTLDNAYGSDLVDFVASGTLGNIPKLFGAEDGISIGSRGSVGVPALLTPGSSIEDMVPSIRTTKTLIGGFAQAVNSVRENSGLNGRELSEIVSTNAVNGTLKNIAQLGLGYSVDRSGQLVNADTRRFPDVLARSFELRTLNETRKFKEMARDRLHNEQKADHSRRLNKRLRSAMRGGNISDEDLNEIATSHFRAGGTVSSFKNRLRQAAIVGQVEVSERNLIEAIKRNDDQNRIMRLMRLNDDASE